jgi:hypothetical protein
MSMSIAAKAAWPLLWCHCDDQGAFAWKPIVLKALIFPADNVDFASILSELEGLQCIKKVEIDGKQVGLVRNFGKYQRPQKRKTIFVIPAEYHPFIALATDSSVPVANQGGNGTVPVANQDDNGTPSIPCHEGTDIVPVPYSDGTGMGNRSQREEGIGEGKKERKKDAAASGALGARNGPTPDLSDQKTQLYARAYEVLGPNSGGMTTKLLEVKSGSVPQARAAIEASAERADPREYLAAIIRGKRDPPARRPGTDPSGIYDRV